MSCFMAYCGGQNKAITCVFWAGVGKKIKLHRMRWSSIMVLQSKRPVV